MRPALLTLLAAALATPAAAQGTQTEPPAAAPAAAAPRLVDLQHMSCGQYTALPDADRAPVVWYIAGFHKAAGAAAKHFDLDAAAKVVDATSKACADKPAASLRYTVGAVFASWHTKKK
jgi:hypothetical protein